MWNLIVISVINFCFQPEFEDSLELLCSFVRRQMRRAATEKFELEREASHPPVPIPYLFLTPKVNIKHVRLYI